MIWRPRGGLAYRFHSFGELVPIQPKEWFELRLWFNRYDILILDPNLLEKASSKFVSLFRRGLLSFTQVICILPSRPFSLQSQQKVMPVKEYTVLP